MSGKYRVSMDQKDIVKAVNTTVDSFIRDRLIYKDERNQHKEQCAERLAAEGGDREVEYSDQAVLANLDWGIEALEEAIETSNMETKLARLDHAEKMLHVCAMLKSDQKTAGVPNFYLSAWAHLNLAYLSKMKNSVPDSVHHVLEMFIVDPFFSRIDFAPELWRDLFLPHMGSIVAWYAEERSDMFFDESLIVRPDQVDKLQKLEQLFGESLDESTRLYAKYFRDCINSESNPNGKVFPMFPIAEPPMTPLNEVSRAIPDFVKFGPILPTSAGFSSFSKSGDRSRRIEPYVASQHSGSVRLDPEEQLPEEDEDESDYDEHDDVTSECDDKVQKLHSAESAKETKFKSLLNSPTVFSPLYSPIPSPKPEVQIKSQSVALLRLKSIRSTEVQTRGLPITASSLLAALSPSKSYSNSSIDSDGEESHKNSSQKCSQTRRFQAMKSRKIKNGSMKDDNEGSQSCVSLQLSDDLTSKSRPPKDFVCPITGQIFSDPVTLETGQTYERKAIQEWLKRGNTTCPITRQPLSGDNLPKTNYVLKRLITSWKEQLPNPPQEFQSSETPRDRSGHDYAKDSPSDFPIHRNKRFVKASMLQSPTSVISQAEAEKIINSLKPNISCLCTSEDLRECEAAVLEISRLWKDSKGDFGVHSFLSEPTVVNGFVEILSASLNRDVLRTSIYVLSELISADETIREFLTTVDSDLYCLAALLKNGLTEAAILICQIQPTFPQLSAHDLVPFFVKLISSKIDESDDLQFTMEPKDAAIAMLEQILTGGDENSKSITASSIISGNGIPNLVKLLDRVEGRRSIVSILLCCMKAEKSCRDLIANRIKLCPVLKLFHSGNDSVRGICVGFLSELVQLNRRTLSNQILQTIKDEGAFSSMHAFLVYLQMAPMEQQPAIANLLLQLDLLVEPRKMSIYREEAIEALIEALCGKQFSNSQFMAIDALSSLIGRITSSGDSYTEAWLLKTAGFDQPYNALMKAEQLKKHETDVMETLEEEEKALTSWEKRVAFVLCNHEEGSIFKALEECLRSSSLKMAKSCLVIATWLAYMLSKIPDTGVKIIARKSLLDEFINVLQSSKNQDDKILAALSLRTFIIDRDATKSMGVYAKCVYMALRKLKRSSSMIAELKKGLMNLSSVDATELWSCTELVQLNLSENGEVLSLIHLRGQILSSHSDGTIKVWDARKSVPRLVQEIREHTKAVTCLYASPLGDKLYSASLDKTIRIWAIKPEEIRCVQVHDVREAVYDLTADTNVACYISQGTGVKIYDWSGTPKHVNFNKYVKCLAMTGNKLYCGCSGYSIQEVDLCSYKSSTFYSGTRKLLGKQAIYSLQTRDGVLFAGASSIDSSAGKIFSLSNKAIIGSFPIGVDIQRITVNDDFIFTATKSGNIEVWLKERFTRVASIKMNSGNSKITSLVSEIDGGMLYAGSFDGKIQVWDLN